MPRISVVTPAHDIPEKERFLARIKDSLDGQTFRDFEWIVTENGKGMASNTNEAIRQARGHIVKILYLDDFLAHEGSLKLISDGFTGGWLVTGCLHEQEGVMGAPHLVRYPSELVAGDNGIGSPSVLAFENRTPKLFDESLSWLLDCDLYRRLGDRYGPPTILDDLNVVIGLGPHQVTNTMPDEAKRAEYTYLANKYS